MMETEFKAADPYLRAVAMITLYITIAGAVIKRIK